MARLGGIDQTVTDRQAGNTHFAAKGDINHAVRGHPRSRRRLNYGCRSAGSFQGEVFLSIGLSYMLRRRSRSVSEIGLWERSQRPTVVEETPSCAATAAWLIPDSLRARCRRSPGVGMLSCILTPFDFRIDRLKDTWTNRSKLRHQDAAETGFT